MLTIGSITTGTHDTCVLIEELLFTFDNLLGDRPRSAIGTVANERKLYRDALKQPEDKRDVVWQDIIQGIFDTLVDNVMFHFLPAFTTIGMHSGDGADFGVWVDHEALECEDKELLLRVSEIPDGESIGCHALWVLVTNDHGNQTLYTVREGNVLHHEWSVV